MSSLFVVRAGSGSGITDNRSERGTAVKAAPEKDEKRAAGSLHV
jgi:hypothetical protein